MSVVAYNNKLREIYYFRAFSITAAKRVTCLEGEITATRVVISVGLIIQSLRCGSKVVLIVEDRN